MSIAFRFRSTVPQWQWSAKLGLCAPTSVQAHTLMLPDKVLQVMTDLLYANYGSNLERRVSTLNNVRTLSMPALVIHDDSDTDIPWEDGRAVADAWPGAEFMLTHGLGHRRILRDPAVVAAITEFIRKE